MKKLLLVGVFTVAAVLAALAACGADEDSCSGRGGIVCSDCSGAGDCDITCAPGETQTCVGMEYFTGIPSNERCAFCE